MGRDIKITIKKGDITTFEGDAIVNAANNQLLMGGGVAGAIKRAGGSEIEKEAVLKGPIPIGEAISTSAGKLKVKYIIHSAVMGRDLKTSGEYIRRATISALREAENLKLKNIAFPALGTGVGGFPYDECARIMKNAIIEFEKESLSIEEIGFFLFDQEAYEAFKSVFEES
ncbi:MAG: macro domain-containing protein [Candidatus Aminicenantia bacterium]